MGISASTAQSTQISQVALRQTTQVNNNCYTVIQKNIQDVSFNIIGSNTGNIEVSNKGEIDINCTFQSNITSISQALIDQANENAAETEGGGLLLPITPLGANIAITNSTTVSELSVELENLINNYCSTNISETVSGITFNIVQSTTGDIAVGNFSTPQSTCVITNLAKIESQLENVQESNNNSGGRSGIIFTIIIIVVVIVVILAIVSFFLSKKKKCEPIPPACIGKTGESLGDCLATQPPLKGKKQFCVVPPATQTKTTTTKPTTTTKSTVSKQ